MFDGASLWFEFFLCLAIGILCGKGDRVHLPIESSGIGDREDRLGSQLLQQQQHDFRYELYHHNDKHC